MTNKKKEEGSKKPEVPVKDIDPKKEVKGGQKPGSPPPPYPPGPC